LIRAFRSVFRAVNPSRWSSRQCTGTSIRYR
jgi:hypothetical protein